MNAGTTQPAGGNSNHAVSIRYRLFKLECVDSQVPDGYHVTNYSVFTLSQKGYLSDFDTYDDAVAHISESTYFDTSEYTILPIITKTNFKNQ